MTTQLPKLTFTDKTPGYVRRAYRVVWREFGIDVREMPVEDWTPILIAACDHDRLDSFADAIKAATKKVVERRYWWGKYR